MRFSSRHFFRFNDFPNFPKWKKTSRKLAVYLNFREGRWFSRVSRPQEPLGLPPHLLATSPIGVHRRHFRPSVPFPPPPQEPPQHTTQNDEIRMGSLGGPFFVFGKRPEKKKHGHLRLKASRSGVEHQRPHWDDEILQFELEFLSTSSVDCGFGCWWFVWRCKPTIVMDGVVK